MAKNPYYDNSRPTPNLLSKESIGTAFLYGCAAGAVGVGMYVPILKKVQEYTDTLLS